MIEGGWDVSDFEIRLTGDEAVVLFEYLSRSSESKSFSVNDKSELFVLEHILCSLESVLGEPFVGDYSENLKLAQKRIRAGAA